MFAVVNQGWKRYAVEWDGRVVSELGSKPTAEREYQRLTSGSLPIMMDALVDVFRYAGMVPDSLIAHFLAAGLSAEQIDTAREFADEVMQGISPRY